MNVKSTAYYSLIAAIVLLGYNVYSPSPELPILAAINSACAAWMFGILYHEKREKNAVPPKVYANGIEYAESGKAKSVTIWKN